MTEPLSLRSRWNVAAIAAILLLVTLAWLRFVWLQPLAPPDFYRYHAESEQLWRGEGGAMRLPLLYPLISGALGRILTIAMSRREAFILAGKILSLLGALGVFFAIRLLMGRTSRPLAMAWSALFVLSPLVLKFIAFPLTDLPFLALFLGAITAFFHRRTPLSVLLALASAGIRFEGLLLLLLIIVLSIPWRKRSVFFLVPALILLAVDFFYLAARITPRLLQYTEQWVLGRAPSLWQKPLFLFRVITENLLFFVPSQWPREVQLALAVAALICMIAGAVAAWRWNPRAAVVLFIFMLGVLGVKGYILFEGDWKMHTRRLLPVLAPAWALVGMGAGMVAARLKRIPGPGKGLPWGVLPVTVGGILMMPGLKPWWPALMLFPVAVFSLNQYRKWTAGTIAMTLALTLLLWTCAGIGFWGSLPLVEAMPNSGGIAVAQWLDSSVRLENKRILMFSNSDMIRYYLEKPAQWVEWKVNHWQGRKPLETYWRRFMSRLNKEKIDFIVMDRYMPATSSRKQLSLKALIWRRYGDTRYFRFIRPIKWKGIMRAIVLAPILQKTPAKDS